LAIVVGSSPTTPDATSAKVQKVGKGLGRPALLAMHPYLLDLLHSLGQIDLSHAYLLQGLIYMMILLQNLVDLALIWQGSGKILEIMGDLRDHGRS
jgi:hypothetical protein